MTEELNLEEVVALPVEELKEEHTTFLNEHVEELSDEQKETFKDVLKPVEPKNSDEEVVPEYRFAPKKIDEKKTDEEEEEDDEVDPNDKKLIGKMVEKGLKPVKDLLDQQSQTTKTIQDQTEVDAFINVKPEAKPYRAKMLTYMKAEHYNVLPIHSIFKIVAGDDLEKIGAEKERLAREKAEATHDNGSSVRPTTSVGKDWNKATPQEIADQKAKIFGYNN
jgi:hypothetical protein